MTEKIITAAEFKDRLAALCMSGARGAFPRRYRDREILYRSVVQTLETTKEYSELALNSALQHWLSDVGAALDIDHVTLRRYLVDEAYLIRDSSGGRYTVNLMGHGHVEFEQAVTAIDSSAAVQARRSESAERKRKHSVHTNPAASAQQEREEPIHIVPYDQSWPSLFESETEVISNALGDWVTGGINHVGSTAVPGLAAKPVIDIMVGVENLQRARLCIPILESIGYCYFPYRAYMHWFCKPSPYRRTHHLHLMEPTDPHWEARIAFRDYLRANEDARKDYETLKRQLAEKFRNDREAYTEGKSEFIGEIVRRALGRTIV